MKTVLIPLADGFEELEAVTIMDILVRAGAKVVRAGLTSGVVKGSRGTRILPDTTLDDVFIHSFDLIVLPGGQPGSDNLMNSDMLKELLQDQVKSNRPVAAICAAPRVLVNSGVAELQTITCYPGSLSDLNTKNIEVTSNAIQESGLIYTSRGPGTALAFALFLTEKLFGDKTRLQVESGLMV